MRGKETGTKEGKDPFTVHGTAGYTSKATVTALMNMGILDLEDHHFANGKMIKCFLNHSKIYATRAEDITHLWSTACHLHDSRFTCIPLAGKRVKSPDFLFKDLLTVKYPMLLFPWDATHTGQATLSY